MSTKKIQLKGPNVWFVGRQLRRLTHRDPFGDTSTATIQKGKSENSFR